MALDSNGIAYGVTRLVRPRGTHKATIVWLHDIGENGDDSARFVRELNLPNIKWICPTAPTRPVSRLGGAVTTAWCDVTQVSENMEHDLASINTTCVLVANLLAGEPAHGVGGLGLGAAQALYFASCYVVGGMRDMGLNAVVGINGWLPAWTNFLYHIDSLTVSGTLAASLPILLTNENSMVPIQFGWLSEQSLSRAGGILQLLEIGSKHTSSSRTNARILNKAYNGLRTRHGGLKCSTTTFDIHFGDIIVKNVSHPILIGQEYVLPLEPMQQADCLMYLLAPWPFKFMVLFYQVVLKMLPEMVMSLSINILILIPLNSLEDEDI
ncbi:PREDICTED: uncharacterized protein LOC106330482 [Brassica oleracea var. oleracea]|uniref:uncharacterized protein LOC106330482 n=1 Tax=Brassica oleracea var. oleracea TaxID=109376 RepID=UPI0006A75740|nr:PREDICTED: uncharacterized protein LOC106330482 [Brassica oleracea var. oleracea]